MTNASTHNVKSPGAILSRLLVVLALVLFGLPDSLYHRQSKREERGKRGARIDPIGHDAGKKIKGKKRHILVDTLGLLMHVVIHAANIQDRDGDALVLGSMFRRYPFLTRLFVDGGYQGPIFAAAQKKALPWVTTEIVKRSDKALGFEVLPKRWCRTDFRLVEPVSSIVQGPRKPDPKRSRFRQIGINSTDAPKALSGLKNFPDGLSRMLFGKSISWRRHAVRVAEIPIDSRHNSQSLFG